MSEWVTNLTYAVRRRTRRTRTSKYKKEEPEDETNCSIDAKRKDECLDESFHGTFTRPLLGCGWG